jgi:protein-tyrosine phosphatase
MNQIQPHRLWVGHADDATGYQLLLDAGIEALVQLGEEQPPARPPYELIYCRFPLIDGTGNRPETLRLAIDTVAALVRLGVPTLVSCDAGLSRSPVIVAAALAIDSGEPPEVCLRRVVSHHPGDVSPGLWHEVVGMLGAG